MIPKRELEQLRAEWTLDIGVIEKDYVLGWLLAAIANNDELAQTWIFKGGTCLRKCYYETYRFSEDLDFTVINGGPEETIDLLRIFTNIADWLRDESGIELNLDGKSFQRRRNLRGNATTQARIAYRGPNPPSVLPKVKIDLSSDEVLVRALELREVGHQYSDGPLPTQGVACYQLAELFGEKLRALAERCRPRDLYDVVHMHRHPDMVGMSGEVAEILSRKCEFAHIEVPTLDLIQSSPFREEIEVEWENMLGHQLPGPLPPFDEFWRTLDDVFAWLAGILSAPVLPRASSAEVDSSWSAPRAISSWRAGVPLELLRYAGANRLKVEIDYRAEKGRQGPRIVEPYSLRMAQNGRLLLFVVNDYGALRSYAVDRIASIRPTTMTFTPSYLVEF